MLAPGALGQAAPAISPERVTLPVEVIGEDGFERSVFPAVNDPGNGPVRLWLEVNGLEYDRQAEVRLNGGEWLPIASGRVSMEGALKPFGIGGGVGTVRLRILLPVGSVVPGTNEIRFRFVGTDGASSGYRVLALNLLGADGKRLIGDSQFRQEDPSKWKAPRPLPADVQQGRILWNGAALIAPVAGRPAQPIRAHCGDCHTSDGRDLAYFNYSNQSIIARSRFHGLSTIQGEQIASYIRLLPVPRPGRPWNPPYQPGPGMDAKPVELWAAGAGLESVAASDRETLIATNAQNGRINMRETPLAIQLPDWNDWLPRVHPLDAYGQAFADNRFSQDYPIIRDGLKPGDTASYKAQRYNWENWSVSFYNLFFSGAAEQIRTASDSERIYSAALWRLVKEWEIAQKFQLEGQSRAYYDERAEPRSWTSTWPFRVSPNMLHIPRQSRMRGYNETDMAYVDISWYFLQLILNAGNGRQYASSPVDWPYIHGAIKDLNRLSGMPQAGLQLLVLSYGLQLANLAPHPEAGPGGWIPFMSDPSRLVHHDWEPNWSDTPADLRAAVTEAHLRRWWAAVREMPREAWFQGGWAKEGEAIVPGRMDGSLGEKTLYMLPRLRAVGVDPALIGQITLWARSMWPQADWTGAGAPTAYMPGAGRQY